MSDLGTMTSKRCRDGEEEDPKPICTKQRLLSSSSSSSMSLSSSSVGSVGSSGSSSSSSSTASLSDDELVINTREELEALVRSLGTTTTTLPTRLRKIDFSVIYNRTDAPALESRTGNFYAKSERHPLRPGSDRKIREHDDDTDNDGFTFGDDGLRVCDRIVPLLQQLLPANRKSLQSVTPWVIPDDTSIDARMKQLPFPELKTVHLSADVCFLDPRSYPVDNFVRHAQDTADNLLLACGQTLEHLYIDHDVSPISECHDDDAEEHAQWPISFLEQLVVATMTTSGLVGSRYLQSLKTLVIQTTTCQLKTVIPLLLLLAPTSLQHLELQVLVLDGWRRRGAHSLGKALSRLTGLETLSLWIEAIDEEDDDDKDSKDSHSPVVMAEWHLPKLTSLTFIANICCALPRLVAPLLSSDPTKFSIQTPRHQCRSCQLEASSSSSSSLSSLSSSCLTTT